MHNKLKELVQNSDLGQVQKNVAMGILTRAENEENSRRSFRDIVETLDKRTEAFDLVLTLPDEVIIYKVDGKSEWEVKYPFRIVIQKNGIWTRYSVVCRTFDEAILSYFQGKYLGDEGSDFTLFAMKMLGFDLTEK